MAHGVRRKLAVSTVFGLALGGGVALAQWTATGVGGGGAFASASVDVTVTGGPAAADLYPGSTGDLAVELDNPNGYAVRFTTMTGGVVTPSTGTCPAAAVALVDGPVDVVVPAHADGHPVVLDDVVRMDRSAPDGCQGATFSIEVALTGTQV